MRVAHIGVWTRDLDAAADFWRRCFDAEVGEPYHSRRRPGFVSRFLALPGGGPRIELMTGPWVADAPAEAVGWDHVAVSLDSPAAVDALAERCRAEGCLVSPPRTTGDGFYEAVVAMPGGTRIEITG
jgi:lactoylglutathione lyase